MKTILYALLGISLASMWLLNFSAGIIGGLWLLFTGEWGLVIGGLIASFVMPFLYSIAMLPQLLVAALLVKTAEKGYRLITSILIFIIAFYCNFLLVWWVSSTFDWIIRYDENLPIFALWLWAYSIAIGPISYMAAKEGPDAGLGTGLGVLFTQISFFILSIGLLFGNIEAGYGWVWFFLLIYSIISASLGFYSIPKKEKTPIVTTPAIHDAEIVSETQDTIYCTDCGYQIESSSKFCKHCGFKIPSNS